MQNVLTLHEGAGLIRSLCFPCGLTHLNKIFCIRPLVASRATYGDSLLGLLEAHNICEVGVISVA